VNLLNVDLLRNIDQLNRFVVDLPRLTLTGVSGTCKMIPRPYQLLDLSSTCHLVVTLLFTLINRMHHRRMISGQTARGRRLEVLDCHLPTIRIGAVPIRKELTRVDRGIDEEDVNTVLDAPRAEKIRTDFLTLCFLTLFCHGEATSSHFLLHSDNFFSLYCLNAGSAGLYIKCTV
jgi:hypothetical protein